MAYEHSPSRYQTYEDELELDMQEVSPAIEATFIKHEGPVVLACGDDRRATPESLKALADQGLPIESAYMRCFGGVYGATRVMLAAAVAQHGPRVVEHLGASFLETAEEVARRASQHDVIMISHSAASTEGRSDHLNKHSNEPLGCAYAAGIGAVSNLTAHNELVIRSAEYESTTLFGVPQNGNIQQLVGSNSWLVENVFGKTKTMSIERRDVLSTKVPAMILEGSHAPTEDVFHVYNFTEDRISDPREANARGLHYYATDITQLVEVLKKSFPELELDSDLLANAIILDVAATKAALAQADGPADPQRMESQRLGDVKSALAHLSTL